MTAPVILPDVPVVPLSADLPLRRVAREELVCAPGDFITVQYDEAALWTVDTPTHKLVLCDHFGQVHTIPCTTGKYREGLWLLTGTTKQPSLRPHVVLTRYKGYIAFGALTPDLTPRG